MKFSSHENTKMEHFQKTMQILKDGGVLFYPNPRDSTEALGALNTYGHLKRRDFGLPESFPDINTGTAKTVIEQARQTCRAVLSATEVSTIFEAYGIPVNGWSVDATADEAAAAAENIGFR